MYYKACEDPAEHLIIIIQILRDHQLYVMKEKYDFGMNEVKFLGRLISQDCITMDPAKTYSIVQ